MTAGTQTPWYKTWKLIPALLFLPFTLMYLTWQSNLPRIVKGVIIMILLISVIGIGASGEDSSDTNSGQASNQLVEVKPTATPMPEVTLEQKQADYETFYKKYMKHGQAVVLTQVTLLEIANGGSSVEEIYLALDKLASIQSGLAMESVDIEIPSSLKEYKSLSSGKMKLAVASRHLKSAIENFQKYLNDNDLEALSEAKYKAELGESQLTESINEVESVAIELGVDVEAIDVNAK